MNQNIKTYDNKRSSSLDEAICELLAEIFEDGLAKLKNYNGIIKNHETKR